MTTTRTYQAKAGELVSDWYVIDATDVILGRLATFVATKLTGKDKPQYSPHVLTGDSIVVINADKIAVTGSKLTSKKYYRHSGYPGGLTATTLEEQLAKDPRRVIEHAVRGMLPKNKLARHMMGRLHVYAGADHPHAPQQPKELKVK
jgi:large subunit ribosomal protein L13